MTRILEPNDLRLGVSLDHSFGYGRRDILILAAKDKELAHGRLAQHLVLILATNHSIEQCHDTLILGDVDNLGQVIDIISHRTAIIGCKTRLRSGVGQQLLLTSLDQRNLALAVGTFLVAIGIGSRREQHHAIQALGILLTECQRHISTHRVTYQGAALDSEGVEHRLHRVGKELHRVALALDLRDSVTRHIERNDTRIFVDQRHKILPNEQ